jgi:TctA family transporter
VAPTAVAPTAGLDLTGGWWRELVECIWPMVRRRKLALLVSSSIGALIGILPGAGADIAAWISYAVSKRFSRHPEEYGRGSLEGLADAGGANNSALGGAWVPALVFGIPGDSVTAIAIGVLLMKNITPGPDVFDPAKGAGNTSLALTIFVTFFICNVVLIPIGMLAIQAGTLLIRIPRRILLPLIVMFCIVGSYAMNASYFDVWVMLAMGLLGFVLEAYKVPIGPIVLGLVLGGEVEHKFIQCITKEASLAPFFAGPISITLAVACLALWCAPVLTSALRRAPKRKASLE